MNKFTKPRFLFAYLVLPVLFLTARTTEHSLRLGIAFALLGVGIRLWANGYVGHRKVNQTQPGRGDTKIGCLVTAGPYAHIRHPLYFGSFLIGLGLCGVVGPPLIGIAALGLLWIAYRRKMQEEDTMLDQELGEEFARYRQAVPAWFPTWRHYPQAQGNWSWEGIRASKEFKTASWVGVLLILFYLREEIFQEHEAFFGKEAPLRIGLLVVMVCLMLSDGIAELRRMRAKRVAHASSASAS